MSPALEVVGRESEIDSVRGFLEAVPGGPVALLIEGDLGIGKTTLWREGVAEAGARELHVLSSRPVEAHTAAFCGLRPVANALGCGLFMT